MKANKITLDWIMRLNLYILPLFLLILSAVSCKSDYTVNTSTENFISFKDINVDYSVSDTLFNCSVSNHNFSLYDITQLPSVSSVYDTIDDVNYYYSLVSFDCEYLSMFDNSFDFYIIVNEDFTRYAVYPNFSLIYDNITYLTFTTSIYTNNIGRARLDSDVVVLNDLTTLNILSDDTFDLNFYNTFNSFLSYSGNYSTTINDIISYDISSFVYSYILFNFYTYQTDIVFNNFLDYNLQFNNIMKPILDLPFSKQFYNWFSSYVIQGDIVVLENVFAWIFYFVFVEFAILIKNVLIFLFYWANKLMERGLNIND